MLMLQYLENNEDVVASHAHFTLHSNCVTLVRMELTCGTWDHNVTVFPLIGRDWKSRVKVAIDYKVTGAVMFLGGTWVYPVFSAFYVANQGPVIPVSWNSDIFFAIALTGNPLTGE